MNVLKMERDSRRTRNTPAVKRKEDTKREELIKRNTLNDHTSYHIIIITYPPLLL